MFFPRHTFMSLALGLAAMAVLVASPKPSVAFWDDITSAITGHIADFQARSKPDEILAGATVVKQGSFRTDDPGQDTAHYGSGDVTLVEKDGQYFVQMQPNVDIGFAPDLFVYVSNTATINTEAAFDAAPQLELGMMVKGSGASWYALPENLDPKGVMSVTVWCKRFAEFMASADLMPAD